jgi:hypothetical protein
MGEFAGGAAAGGEPLPERRPFVLGQGDQVALAHAVACPLALRAGERRCDAAHCTGGAGSGIVDPRDAGYVHVGLARLHRRERGLRKGGRPWRATGQYGPVVASCRVV